MLPECFTVDINVTPRATQEFEFVLNDNGSHPVFAVKAIVGDQSMTVVLDYGASDRFVSEELAMALGRKPQGARQSSGTMTATEDTLGQVEVFLRMGPG